MNRRRGWIKDVLSVCVGVGILLQVTGCGTLLYPERRGQTGGRIDAGVAVLDGIGLLFFLIPGIIAYAVDFSNGTIYLPPGEAMLNGGTVDGNDITVVRVDPAVLDPATIESVLERHLGRDIDFGETDLQVIDPDGSSDVRAELARVCQRAAGQ